MPSNADLAEQLAAKISAALADEQAFERYLAHFRPETHPCKKTQCPLDVYLKQATSGQAVRNRRSWGPSFQANDERVEIRYDWWLNGRLHVDIPPRYRRFIKLVDRYVSGANRRRLRWDELTAQQIRALWQQSAPRPQEDNGG